MVLRTSLLIAACVVPLLPARSAAAEGPGSAILEGFDQDVRRLQERYDAARDDVKQRLATLDKTFAEESKKLWDATLGTLKEQQSASLEANNLQAVLAIDKAVQEFEKSPVPVPRKDPLESLSKTTASRLRRRIKALEGELSDVYGTDRQLLENGSFEQAAPVGVVPGWEKAEGDWNPVLPNHVRNKTPADGAAFFYAGACKKGVLRQRVDLRAAGALIDQGRVTFLATCRMMSLPQQAVDTTELKIDFLNAEGEVIDSFSSNALKSIGEWSMTRLSHAAPRGSRAALVSLIARRYGRGEESNDGYFDDVKFRITRSSP